MYSIYGFYRKRLFQGWSSRLTDTELFLCQNTYPIDVNRMFYVISELESPDRNINKSAKYYEAKMRVKNTTEYTSRLVGTKLFKA